MSEFVKKRRTVLGLPSYAQPRVLRMEEQKEKKESACRQGTEPDKKVPGHPPGDCTSPGYYAPGEV